MVVVVILSVSDGLVISLRCVLVSFMRLSGRCADAVSRWSRVPWYAINCSITLVLVFTVVDIRSCWRVCHVDSDVVVHGDCGVVTSVRGGCRGAEGIVSVRLLISCDVVGLSTV